MTTPPTSTPFKPPPNTYTRRLVAPTSPKPCYICHKPTPTVLITLCSRDFFYICQGHLRDRGFATPAPGEPGAESSSKNPSTKTKEDHTKAEIARINDEYTVRRARRKAHLKAVAAKAKKKDAATEKDKNGKRIKDDTDPSLDKLDDEDESGKGEDFGTDSADEREKKAKIEAVRAKAVDGVDGRGGEVEARSFVLHKDIYGMRVQRMKDAALGARRRVGDTGGLTGRGMMGKGSLVAGMPSVPRTL